MTDGAPAQDIVTALYLRTRELHTQAERTGIIRDLLRGEAARDGYVLMMRNLAPAYRALEDGLARHAATPALRELSGFALGRAEAAEIDLAALAGPDWATTVPLLPQGEAYAARIAACAAGDGGGLIAHAYTRYLGDLSGGQILKKLLARTLELTPGQTTFYEFPQQLATHGTLKALKDAYRAAIARAGMAVADPDAVIAEGAAAFEHNIAVSCAVKDALPQQAD